MPKYSKKGSINDRVMVLDFLRTVTTPDGDGYVRYMDEWTDNKVSQHFKRRVSPGNVATLRREHLGKDRQASARSKAWRDAQPVSAARAVMSQPEAIPAGLGVAVMAMESRLVHIEKQLNAIIDAFQIPIK